MRLIWWDLVSWSLMRILISWGDSQENPHLAKSHETRLRPSPTHHTHESAACRFPTQILIFVNNISRLPQPLDFCHIILPRTLILIHSYYRNKSWLAAKILTETSRWNQIPAAIRTNQLFRTTGEKSSSLYLSLCLGIIFKTTSHMSAWGSAASKSLLVAAPFLSSSIGLAAIACFDVSVLILAWC